MRDFPPAQPGERIGTLINRVRSVVRAIQPGETVERVIELIGDPDKRERGLIRWLPDLAKRQIVALKSRFFRATSFDAEETFSYVNPYQPSITHFIAFADGKVTKVWEFQRTDT